MTHENAHQVKRGEAIIPDSWREFYNETRVPAAIKIDNLLRLTGHTGETSDGWM